MAGFELLPELASPAVVFPFPEVHEADELWPPHGTPEPNLQARRMTEARCVIQFFHGEKTADRLDALLHLANICTLKAGRGFWSPRPGLKFVGASTWKQDWENCDPHQPFLRKKATKGWFTIHLPEHIEKYSPRHTTKRELLELARIHDGNLLHVCQALTCDMFDASDWEKRHEIQYATLKEQDGEQFYWNPDREQKCSIQMPAPPPSFTPDYAGAVEALVRDKRFRTALSPRVCQTFEMILRKLAAGVDADEIISAVAKVIKRDERTVKRHLGKATKTAIASGSAKVMEVLAGCVLPDNRALGALAEAAALRTNQT